MRHLSLPGLLLCASVVCSGCYVPPPVTHAVLSVSDGGAYTLDAQAVPAAELSQRLTARRASAANLRVDLHVTPLSSMASIAFAVDAAKQAQVRVDFTHDTAAP